MPKNIAEPKIPADLRKALSADAIAMNRWRDLTPLARREFILWIEQPRKPETRQKRIDSIGSRLASGKRRPCCFTVVPSRLFKALETAPKAKAHWKTLTPDERRVFGSWIDEAKEIEAHKKRVEKACEMLAAGKRHP